LRIISGSARGRNISSPKAKQGRGPIRPTTDRTREALFNIIGQDKIQGALVLDLFAGTGALGLEAVSRGAESAIFVDKHQTALNLVAFNAEQCDLYDSCRILKRDLLKGLRFLKNFLKKSAARGEIRKERLDLVFLDPPYEKFEASHYLRQLQEYELLDEQALVLFEDRATADLPEEVDLLHLSDKRQYGSTGVWFYSY